MSSRPPTTSWSASGWTARRSPRSSPSGTTEERNRAGILLVRFLFSGPSRAGLLHADPHPGNFRLLDDGRLGVLDFGAVDRLPDGFPRFFGKLLRLMHEDRDIETVEHELRAARLPQGGRHRRPRCPARLPGAAGRAVPGGDLQVHPGVAAGGGVPGHRHAVGRDRPPPQPAALVRADPPGLHRRASGCSASSSARVHFRAEVIKWMPGYNDPAEPRPGARLRPGGPEPGRDGPRTEPRGQPARPGEPRPLSPDAGPAWTSARTRASAVPARPGARTPGKAQPSRARASGARQEPCSAASSPRSRRVSLREWTSCRCARCGPAGRPVERDAPAAPGAPPSAVASIVCCRSLTISWRRIHLRHHHSSRLDVRPMCAGQAATSCFRGRPRGRLRGTISPRRNSSPPQTPQGSRRSSAPVRHAMRAGQPRHRSLAHSTSSGDSAKNRSGSSVHGSVTASRGPGHRHRDGDDLRPGLRWPGAAACSDSASNPAWSSRTAVVPGRCIGAIPSHLLV